MTGAEPQSAVQCCHSIAEIRRWRRECSSAQRRVGCVPTMGHLHEGHLGLVRAAFAAGCDAVVVTIFVNPTQFGPAEDYDAYPRTLACDLEKLSGIEHDPRSVLAVFAPPTSEMYPDGVDSAVLAFTVAPTPQPPMHIESVLRPHLYAGIATIVLRLFNICTPDDALFGRKDAFQCDLIAAMARTLNVDVRLHMCPTARETDGLAMSSRNTYIDPAARAHAVALPRACSDAIRTFAALCSGGDAPPFEAPTPLSRVIRRHLVDNFCKTFELAVRHEQCPVSFELQYADVSVDGGAGTLGWICCGEWQDHAPDPATEAPNAPRCAPVG
eukprot:CAMPEP_0174843802 /NCGR_PEP_ID=MMETSP1114-20130205/10750_1 /TAXON_ID=312471 /ORGANISM="Neobodo designis, Strain CCAP 1951/1" /LENGTH=326 /DNA_ID=CAMNT_0016078035 /DNA_START=33 /DNA_END=1009 /DNA_ORIENTATION=+